ncbi:hypothetical protein, partial [Lactobacillus delbrueckii]|uniref:hypothetical protein n=1 Tax=Lactobacillus delbrueckii TaxID=1584 RepID=UPI001E4130F5
FDIDDVVVELYQANKGLVLFLLAKLLNFQGTSPRLQVGSLSKLFFYADCKIKLNTVPIQ